MTYSSEVLADSPIRYWKLDDSTGVDTMGLGNLTKGGTLPSVAGVVNTAWAFNGAGNFATATPLVISTGISVEMWFRVNAVGPAANTFWRTGHDAGQLGLIRMEGSGSATNPGQIRCMVNTTTFYSGTRYDDNLWHHLVLTVGGVNQTLYIDNVVKGTASGSATYIFNDTSFIGTSGYNDEWLTGSLDEIAMYNYALTPARVAAHFNPPPHVTSPYSGVILADTPIGYWSMETVSAYNEITSINNTLIGAPTVNVGRWGNGWTLPNAATLIDLNAGAGYTDFTANNTWSIEAWINTATTSGTYPTIWRRDGASKVVLLRLNAGRIEFYLNGTVVYSTARYDDGAWHHVVISINGLGAGLAKLYVDNINTNSTTSPDIGALGVVGNRHAIGAQGGGGPLTEQWIGQLDEVAIYNYALTAAQVAAHYNYVLSTAFRGWGIHV